MNQPRPVTPYLGPPQPPVRAPFRVPNRPWAGPLDSRLVAPSAAPRQAPPAGAGRPLGSLRALLKSELH
eukprot:1706951-Alexandrium_andersonii.AAC.1